MTMAGSSCWKQQRMRGRVLRSCSSGKLSSSSNGNSSSSSFGPLGEALVQLGLPLAALPAGVLAMMLKFLVSCEGKVRLKLTFVLALPAWLQAAGVASSEAHC